MPIVFDAITELECPDCYWDDDYGYGYEECARCSSGRHLYHRIYVETEDHDPKASPGLSCVVIQYAPSWKEPVNGQVLPNGKYREVTTQISRFDFTITSDDSDVAIFEPHLPAIRTVFGLAKIEQMRTAAIVASRTKKGSTPPKEEDHQKILLACEQEVIARVTAIPAMKDKTFMRWIQPIAKTFVNAAYVVGVGSVLAAGAAGGAGTKKPCPHVGRR